MKFFKPNSEYLDFIYAQDNNIINTKNTIGVAIRLNELIYYLPVNSVNASDYDENHNLKKSMPTILRIFDIKSQKYLGKCLFSNMFPIPYKDLIPLELDDFEECEQKVLEKKLEYLRTQMNRITKSATRLYNQKIRKYSQTYLRATVDFKKLEIASHKWEISHYGKHYNRFPDSQYFLTNSNTEGITEYYLMNKQKKIAKIRYDNSKQIVTGIDELLEIQYAPLECFLHGELTTMTITEWFRGRGIPSWRDGLDDFLDNIGIKNKDVLLNKAFGLSLSDQYWMNPTHMIMEWADINFFENDFNSNDYEMAIFENKFIDNKQIDFYSPNNTSDGMLKKTWIVGDDGKRYMLKGSYRERGMEPFNEVLASMICVVIGLDHVEYSLEEIQGKVLSKCECFINSNTELLSAYSILHYNEVVMTPMNNNIFKSYMDILKSKGLKNVESNLAKMFILDYLIANADRHLGNFGVIRNVETLKWEKFAPNFDSGQALFSQNKVYEMNFSNVTGSFFSEKNVDFETILERVIKYVDFPVNFSALYALAENWKDTLISYQHLSGISFERIEVIVEGFKERISKLKHKLDD